MTTLSVIDLIASLREEVNFLKGENAILCNALTTLGSEKDHVEEQLDISKRRIVKLEQTLKNIVVLGRDFSKSEDFQNF